MNVMTNSPVVSPPLIWANLLHLSYNMWVDVASSDPAAGHADFPQIVAAPHLRFDQSLWNDLMTAMRSAGMNMVLIDVGDGIQFESRPEISVKNAWPQDFLKSEVARLRSMGLEPIPKLNFSTAHDAWLGDYSRMVSSKIYYEVCRDIIAEVSALFDTPRFFHLGMDEETYGHQAHYEYSQVRQGDLWWRDLYFYIDQVEKAGSRAWVWSDYMWEHPDTFFQKMPKSVVQSNWYYGERFDIPTGEPYPEFVCVDAYRKLEEHGYDQIPTGSNWSNNTNFEATVEFCRQHISPERLLGFMTAPWHPTLEERREHHLTAIAEVERARLRLESQ